MHSGKLVFLPIATDHNESVNSAHHMCPQQQLSYAGLQLPYFACCKLALPFYAVYFVTVWKKYTRLVRVGITHAYFCS